MKRTIYILTAIAAFLLTASCQKASDRLLDSLTGDWHYTGEESGVKEDIWVSFAENGTFEMYQKIGEGPYWHTDGEYAVDAETGILSGVYSDRYPWKYSYKIKVDSKSLVMTAVELETYSVTYAREAVPSEVVAKALPLTKAESGDPVVFEGYL